MQQRPESVRDDPNPERQPHPQSARSGLTRHGVSVFSYTLDALQESGHLEPYRSINGDLLVAMDGAEYFSSSKIHCNQCTPTLKKTNPSVLREMDPYAAQQVVNFGWKLIRKMPET